MRKFVIWSAFLLALGVVSLAVLVQLTFWTGSPEIKHNIPSAEWLPMSASNISIYERPGFGWVRIYECSISETEVIKFAKASGWKFEEQENIFVNFRHVFGYEKLSEFKMVGPVDALHKGWLYEKHASNGGGVTSVYDPQKQRLFVSESRR